MALQGWTAIMAGLTIVISITLLVWPSICSFSDYWYHRNVLKGPSAFVHSLHVRRKQKIVRLGRNEFSITDPDLLTTIYADKDFLKSEQYAAFDVDGEASIFSMRDPVEHERRVKAIRGMFKISEVRQRETVIKGSIGRTLKCLLETSGQSPVNVLALIRGFAVETISSYALGARYLESQDLSAYEVGSTFGLILDDINRSASFGRSYAWTVRQCDRLLKWYDSMTRLANHQDSDSSPRKLEEAYKLHSSYCTRVITMLQDDAEYKTQLELLGLSSSALKTEVSDLLFAGTDSTATTLSTALWYLYADEAMLVRLREDLEYVDDDQMASRPFLNAVIDEALRLAQPVPRRLPRIVPHNKDIFYAEDKHNDDWQKILPAGAIVGISAYSLHRDPVFYSAEEFLPERWLTTDKAKKERMRACFVPFGRGHRACIGQELARSEMRLLLKSVVECYDGKSLGKPPNFEDNFNASIAGSVVNIQLYDRK